MQQKVTAQIGGKEVSIETGKIARLADGAVTVTCGDTTVLASAVSGTVVKEGQDFFPLTVDYREKAAAAGKVPGGGPPRPSDKRGHVNPPADLAAIKMDLEPNWDRDYDTAGTISFVLRVP